MQPSVADFRSYEHSLIGQPLGHTASLEILVYSQGIQVHRVHVLRHDNKHCCELDKTFQRAKSYTKEGKKLKSSLSYTTAALFILTFCYAFLLNICFKLYLFLKRRNHFSPLPSVLLRPTNFASLDLVQPIYLSCQNCIMNSTRIYRACTTVASTYRLYIRPPLRLTSWEL